MSRISLDYQAGVHSEKLKRDHGIVRARARALSRKQTACEVKKTNDIHLYNTISGRAGGGQ